MTYETLLVEIAGPVATVTINRPDKLNALNDAVIHELDEAFAALESDDAVRGILLTGAGAKAFVAGADIAELAEQGPEQGTNRARRGQDVFRRIERSGKPVVAAINGFALGGGCELAMACHMRVASETAKFGQPEVKLGLCPGYGGTVRLPRLVGRGRALELLLTGAMIDASEALRIGLVNRIVPADRLMAESAALLGAVLEQGPLAVRACLESVDAGLDLSVDEALEVEARRFGDLSGSDDMREGTAAFLARRPPSFTGK